MDISKGEKKKKEMSKPYFGASCSSTRLVDKAVNDRNDPLVAAQRREGRRPQVVVPNVHVVEQQAGRGMRQVELERVREVVRVAKVKVVPEVDAVPAVEVPVFKNFKH